MPPLGLGLDFESAKATTSTGQPEKSSAEHLTRSASKASRWDLWSTSGLPTVGHTPSDRDTGIIKPPRNLLQLRSSGGPSHFQAMNAEYRMHTQATPQQLHSAVYKPVRVFPAHRRNHPSRCNNYPPTDRPSKYSMAHKRRGRDRHHRDPAIRPNTPLMHIQTRPLATPSRVSSHEIPWVKRKNADNAEQARKRVGKGVRQRCPSSSYHARTNKKRDRRLCVWFCHNVA